MSASELEAIRRLTRFRRTTRSNIPSGGPIVSNPLGWNDVGVGIGGGAPSRTSRRSANDMRLQSLTKSMKVRGVPVKRAEQHRITILRTAGCPVICTGSSGSKHSCFD